MINESGSSNVEQFRHKKSSNIPWVVLVIVIVIAVIGLAIAYFTGFFDKTVATPEPVASEQPTGTNIIAQVNGLPITENEIIQRTQLVLAGLNIPENEITEEQLIQAQQFALQQLVNEILVLSAALNNNILISDQEVQAEFDLLVGNYPDVESFQQNLVANNITEQDIRFDIGKQLTIQKYINANTDRESIEVTEDEVVSLYGQYEEQTEEPLDIEEVRAQLSEQVIQDKLNQQIDQLFQTLQEAANIEILN